MRISHLLFTDWFMGPIRPCLELRNCELQSVRQQLNRTFGIFMYKGIWRPDFAQIRTHWGEWCRMSRIIKTWAGNGKEGTQGEYYMTGCGKKNRVECSDGEEKYTSICVAHFYATRLKCAQTWITQLYLQITPCLPLLPSRRTSPPFGWYSFYRPTEGRRLSQPRWLVTYRNKVPHPGVEPGHGHPSQY